VTPQARSSLTSDAGRVVLQLFAISSVVSPSLRNNLSHFRRREIRLDLSGAWWNDVFIIQKLKSAATSGEMSKSLSAFGQVASGNGLEISMGIFNFVSGAISQHHLLNFPHSLTLPIQAQEKSSTIFRPKMRQKAALAVPSNVSPNFCARSGTLCLIFECQTRIQSRSFCISKQN
jgi:hypothetical protein